MRKSIQRYPFNRHFQKLKGQKGATLIELLISLALLAIITTIFIQIITDSIGLRAKSDFSKEASAIAMSTIETLKRNDQIPTNLDQTVTRPDGYVVRTSLVDVTGSLGLNGDNLGQEDGDEFDNADIVFSIGSNFQIVRSGGVTGGSTLSGLVNNRVEFLITPVAGSTDVRNYAIRYTNNLGIQNYNLGNFTRVAGQRRFVRINVLPELNQSVNFLLTDTTGEPIRFGIFDNLNGRVSAVASGTGTDLLVSDGFVTTGEPDTLTQRYYEVTVVVTRNGDEYARTLTTWAVKGD